MFYFEYLISERRYSAIVFFPMCHKIYAQFLKYFHVNTLCLSLGTQQGINERVLVIENSSIPPNIKGNWRQMHYFWHRVVFTSPNLQTGDFFFWLLVVCLSVCLSVCLFPFSCLLTFHFFTYPEVSPTLFNQAWQNKQPWVIFFLRKASQHFTWGEHGIDEYASNLPLKYLFNVLTAAVAQSVRAFAPQMEDWVFESKPRQTCHKTGSDSSTAKRLAIGVSVIGPRRRPL